MASVATKPVSRVFRPIDLTVDIIDLTSDDDFDDEVVVLGKRKASGPVQLPQGEVPWTPKRRKVVDIDEFFGRIAQEVIDVEDFFAQARDAVPSSEITDDEVARLLAEFDLTN